jgi:hypothetical protein
MQFSGREEAVVNHCVPWKPGFDHRAFCRLESDIPRYASTPKFDINLKRVTNFCVHEYSEFICVNVYCTKFSWRFK